MLCSTCKRFLFQTSLTYKSIGVIIESSQCNLKSFVFYSTKPVRNLYEILGISHDASSIELKNAYIQKAKIFHPDSNKGGAEEFKQIAQAYNVIRNPLQRRKYDKNMRNKVVPKKKENKPEFESKLRKRDKVKNFVEEDILNYKAKEKAKKFSRFADRLRNLTLLLNLPGFVIAIFVVYCDVLAKDKTQLLVSDWMARFNFNVTMKTNMVFFGSTSKKIVLRLLLHAFVDCPHRYGTEGFKDCECFCGDRVCEAAKDCLYHLQTCYSQYCLTCVNTEKLLDHWNSCRSSTCRSCGPFLNEYSDKAGSRFILNPHVILGGKMFEEPMELQT